MLLMAKDKKTDKKRNTIQITLNPAVETRLQKFLDRQRIKPDRAAVALTALLEFLDREEKRGLD